MYLSKLVLNMRSWQARRDAANAYELHRTLMTQVFCSADDDKAQDTGRVLFRIETARDSREHGGPVVLVQSLGYPPDWQRLPDGYCERFEGPTHFTPKVATGQLLAFRLVANPIERRRRHDINGVVLRTSGERKHVRFQRRALLHPDEQERWLERQGMRDIEQGEPTYGGFRPRYVVTSPLVSVGRGHTVTHERKKDLPHVGVRFDGVLEVTDVAAFLNTLASGIGPAKAFGFGLLSVAPLR